MNTEAMQAKRSCKLSWRLHRRYPQIALQIRYSDRSPLYDVRNHARRIPKDASCETMFRGLSNSCCPMAHAVNTLDEERMACLDPRSLDRRRQPPKSFWWRQTGSNRRPHACKARALPAELCPRSRKHEACQPIERQHASPKAMRGGPGKT